MTAYDDARNAITQAETDFLVTQAALTASEAAVAAREATIAEQEVQIDDLHVELLEAHNRIAELEALIPKPDGPMDHYGVCLVLQNGDDYGDLDAVLAELEYLGVRSIRARFQSGERGAKVMDWCVRNGVKWCVSFAPEDWFEVGAASKTSICAQFEDSLRECLALPGALDVVKFIEVANEPNNSRNSTPIADWPDRVIALSLTAQAVRDELAPGIPVLSAAMHVNDHGGADWLKVIGSYADLINLHSYPKGDEVTTLLDERITTAQAAFPGLRVVVSEHGWVVSPPCVPPKNGGPRLVTAEQQETFVSHAPGLFFDHPEVEHAFLFELRDSETGGTGVQDCRGLVRSGTWRPAGEALRALLAAA